MYIKVMICFWVGGSEGWECNGRTSKRERKGGYLIRCICRMYIFSTSIYRVETSTK